MPTRPRQIIAKGSARAIDVGWPARTGNRLGKPPARMQRKTGPGRPGAGPQSQNVVGFGPPPEHSADGQDARTRDISSVLAIRRCRPVLPRSSVRPDHAQLALHAQEVLVLSDSLQDTPCRLRHDCSSGGRRRASDLVEMIDGPVPVADPNAGAGCNRLMDEGLGPPYGSLQPDAHGE